MFWDGQLAARIVGGAVSAFAFVLRKGGNVLVTVQGANVIVYPAEMSFADAKTARDYVVIDCNK